MAYQFLSTISGINTTFTGNSVYSNSTPNRTVKLDAVGLYLSRTSNGGYVSSITADGTMYYDTRNSHIFRNDGTASMTIVDNTRNVLIGTSTDSGYKLDVAGVGRIATSGSGYKLTVATTGGSNGSTLLVSQLGYTMLDVNASDVIFKPYPSTAGQITTSNWNGAGGTHTTFFTKNSEFTPTGGAYAIPIAKFPDANIPVIMGNTTTANLRSYLTVSGNFTAISNLAAGQQITSTLTAAANNDVLVGLDIAPTYTNGAFTGVSNLGLRVTGGADFVRFGSSTNYWSFSSVYSPADNKLEMVSQGGVNYRTKLVNNTYDTRLLVGNYQTFLSFGTYSSQQQMTLFTTGNLAINTTTDAGYKLDVYGTLRVYSGNGSRIEGGGSFTATGFCNFNGAAQSVAGTNCGLLNVQSSLSVGYQGAADASAVMQANSTTKGFLPPRMTAAQRAAISTPATGLIVYQTDSVEGVYVYTSTGWKSLTMV